MSNLYGLFSSKRNSSSLSINQAGERIPRHSSERRQIEPLIQDFETDQSRYYRSTEFQQALLEDQIERSLTPPAKEADVDDIGRSSRYRLSRRSYAASNSSLSAALFDADSEMQRAGERAETQEPRPAYDSVLLGSKAAESSEPSSSPDKSLAPFFFVGCLRHLCVTSFFGRDISLAHPCIDRVVPAHRKSTSRPLRHQHRRNAILPADMAAAGVPTVDHALQEKEKLIPVNGPSAVDHAVQENPTPLNRVPTVDHAVQENPTPVNRPSAVDHAVQENPTTVNRPSAVDHAMQENPTPLNRVPTVDHTIQDKPAPANGVPVGDHAIQDKPTAVNGVSHAVPAAQDPRRASAVQDEENFVPRPMFHHRTVHPVDIEDYFRGPRDATRHSKWPSFSRMHGSILPKMIVPLSCVAAWATLITCISKLVHPLQVDSVLITITGFVVSLALSFRGTTAYERYTDGRKYWAQLLLNARSLSRLIWVHALERHEESAELGKHDLLAKLAALQLINAFAVSLKHRLRFEPSIDYPDLAPLLSHLHTLAGDADQSMLHERRISKAKAVGQYLGVPMAVDNPRRLLKESKENLGNLPLEVLAYLASYVENIFQNKTLTISCHQGQAMTMLFNFSDVLAGCERVVNTPLPVAYSIAIAQITYVYVFALPFQLVGRLHWVSIPATIIAGYIILGLAQIGQELENPFGHDVNDLPLDSFCAEIATDIDILTSAPAALNDKAWMLHSGAKVLWPLSNMEYKAWENKSEAEIRAALKAKAESRDVKHDRMATFVESKTLTNEPKA
ncbi:hypothetical protein AC578_10061 [Pseudocercospora eumusae]|uniref:Uncharacterized protein n=1 Tax=Pseudocercospora eumusae TaxID=321146 RepID=A0A139H874_9PEZI|nr:hypothetical protein AC578_10061 [Pseudocercospora eumusae]